MVHIFYAYTKVAFFATLPFHALAQQRTHISIAYFHILLFQLWLLVAEFFIFFYNFFHAFLAKFYYKTIAALFAVFDLIGGSELS